MAYLDSGYGAGGGAGAPPASLFDMLLGQQNPLRNFNPFAPRNPWWQRQSNQPTGTAGDDRSDQSAQGNQPNQGSAMGGTAAGFGDPRGAMQLGMLGLRMLSPTVAGSSPLASMFGGGGGLGALGQGGGGSPLSMYSKLLPYL